MKKDLETDFIMINPYEEIISKISPLEFEQFCLMVIKKYAEQNNLNDFKITHNKKMRINDENYQIDLFAEFTAINVKFNIIIECKHQRRSIERAEIILLNDKINNSTAHKGILISTSGFQKGAIKRAEKNGIALLQIMDKEIRFVRASLPTELDEQYAEYVRQSSPYFVFQYCGDFPNKQIYPTESMEAELRAKLKKNLRRR
jgi:predicted helicase